MHKIAGLVSSAYDLTFSWGDGGHSTMIKGEDKNSTKEHLLELASVGTIKQSKVLEIIHEVLSVTEKWYVLTTAIDVSRLQAKNISPILSAICKNCDIRIIVIWFAYSHQGTIGICEQYLRGLTPVVYSRETFLIFCIPSDYSISEGDLHSVLIVILVLLKISLKMCKYRIYPSSLKMRNWLHADE